MIRSRKRLYHILIALAVLALVTPPVLFFGFTHRVSSLLTAVKGKGSVQLVPMHSRTHLGILDRALMPLLEKIPSDPTSRFTAYQKWTLLTIGRVRTFNLQVYDERNVDQLLRSAAMFPEQVKFVFYIEGALDKSQSANLCSLLSTLKHLETVHINCLHFEASQLHKLRGHLVLNEITIPDTQIDDDTLDALRNLPALKKINVHATGFFLPPEDMEARVKSAQTRIQEALPGVSVVLTTFPLRCSG
jgi:hypothetical protein